MYMAKCGPDGNFSKGEMVPFGPIALSPSAGVLNYGQVSEWLGGWTWNGRPCFILSAVE
jgi:hypothetical protein